MIVACACKLRLVDYGFRFLQFAFHSAMATIEYFSAVHCHHPSQVRVLCIHECAFTAGTRSEWLVKTSDSDMRHARRDRPLQIRYSDLMWFPTYPGPIALHPRLEPAAVIIAL